MIITIIALLIIIPLLLNYILKIFIPTRRARKHIIFEMQRACSDREYAYWKNELKKIKWEYIRFY